MNPTANTRLSHGRVGYLTCPALTFGKKNRLLNKKSRKSRGLDPDRDLQKKSTSNQAFGTRSHGFAGE